MLEIMYDKHTPIIPPLFSNICKKPLLKNIIITNVNPRLKKNRLNYRVKIKDTKNYEKEKGN